MDCVITKIMNSALFAKSWRVFRLSSSKSLKIFKITDAQLLYGILIALAGDVVRKRIKYYIFLFNYLI
jgi:hypothetical protein